MVDGDGACRVDNACAEADGGPVALTDAPHAHHEAHPAFGDLALVGVHDDAGVAERCGLDGVLAGERRPQQGHSRTREPLTRVQAVGEFPGVPLKRRVEIAVATVETGHDVVESGLHVVVREREDSLHHDTRA